MMVLSLSSRHITVPSRKAEHPAEGRPKQLPGAEAVPPAPFPGEDAATAPSKTSAVAFRGSAPSRCGEASGPPGVRNATECSSESDAVPT